MKKLMVLLLVAAAIVLPLAASGSGEGGQTVLTLSEVHAEGYPTALADYEFARLVEERTEGRIKIDVYTGGTLYGEETGSIEALQIGDRANRWCHKISPELFKAMKQTGRQSRDAAEHIWYSPRNDGYEGGISHSHYNTTRYHGINLHAFFTKGTVEFRLFNGTTHAGKIKAYIQFCLAMSAWAINCDHDDLHFKRITNYTQEQKAALMKRVLINRLGMRGPEFKTARLHLTSTFAAETAQAA